MMMHIHEELFFNIQGCVILVETDIFSNLFNLYIPQGLMNFGQIFQT